MPIVRTPHIPSIKGFYRSSEEPRSWGCCQPPRPWTVAPCLQLNASGSLTCPRLACRLPWYPPAQAQAAPRSAWLGPHPFSVLDSCGRVAAGRKDRGQACSSSCFTSAAPPSRWRSRWTLSGFPSASPRESAWVSGPGETSFW